MSEESLYKSFGHAVAARRTAQKLTQLELGERIGLSRASIANIESGRQNVLLHQVYRLASALSCAQLSDLLPMPELFRNEESLAVKVTDEKGVTAKGITQVHDLIHAALARKGPGKPRS